MIANHARSLDPRTLQSNSPSCGNQPAHIRVDHASNSDTLVTTCYRPNERGKAQALNDFLVFGTTATASFLAGFLQERLGWFPLNRASIVLILVALLAVVWLRVQQRRPVLA